MRGQPDSMESGTEYLKFLPKTVVQLPQTGGMSGLPSRCVLPFLLSMLLEVECKQVKALSVLENAISRHYLGQIYLLLMLAHASAFCIVLLLWCRLTKWPEMARVMIANVTPFWTPDARGQAAVGSRCVVARALNSVLPPGV